MDDSRRSSAPPKEPNGRVCTVCSDRANGYNFGVLTCESCKAFFRRNAAKHHEIKCPFSDSCQITSASRKFCQACRLNKCFSVGMNSDWLSGDVRPKNGTKFKRRKADIPMKMELEEEEEEEQKEEKVTVSKALLEKLIQNSSEHSKTHCTCTCQCGFYPPSQKLTAYTKPEDVKPKDENCCSEMAPCESEDNKLCLVAPQDRSFSQAVQHSDPFLFSSSSSSSTQSPSSLISCTPSPRNSSTYSTPQLLPHSPSTYMISPNSLFEMSPPSGPYTRLLSPNTFEMMPNLPSSFFPPMPDFNWNAAFTTPSGLALPTQQPPVELLERIHKNIDKYIGTLTEHEMKYLEELHVHNEPLRAPLQSYFDARTVEGVAMILREATTRIITMICQLSTFRALPQQDRKNLLKDGFSQLVIVRGLMAFDRNAQSWTHSFGCANKMIVRLDVLNDPKTSEHYKEHKAFIDSFDDDVKNHESLMLIFNAIVIYHHYFTKLTNQELVRSTETMYFGMLNKILIADFGEVRADQMYKKLLKQVMELNAVSKSLMRVFYGLDPCILDPLLFELISHV
ncbi:unnamed protein product [Caenorhabditis sp. 36 PRJEB53466]|nr:unnamed protein product [Caenorhabditis sp. 36 PRJEB53466]